jgi:hypothetical protein
MLSTLLAGLIVLQAALPAQAPAETSGGASAQAAISQLGSFDFQARTSAAALLRRRPAAEVVPLLEAAARSHDDEYVRYRALVLLSGIDTGAMTRVAADLLSDPNDRVRTVVYQWFERQPRPEMTPRLIQALAREASEFVRPALLRALAAAGDSPQLREILEPLVFRGDDLFRGSVIVALGDYGRTFAVDEIRQVAALDGPLQDDAVTALGRLGDKSVLPDISRLQKEGPRQIQPTVSAALCLLGVDCEARLAFVGDTLRFAATAPDRLDLLRGAVHAAGVLARSGHAEMFETMVDAALKSNGAARDTLTLGIGTVILRNPEQALDLYEARAQAPEIGELYLDAFDMLAEEFDKEQFGAAIRRVLWTSPEGSPRRQSASALLDALEF